MREPAPSWTNGSGAPIINYESTGLNTDISMRENEPVIVVTLNVGPSGDAMTLAYGWLQRLMCGQGEHFDHTDEVINDAERTRRELVRLTDRLTGHVAQLQAFTRAYAARPERGTTRG